MCQLNRHAETGVGEEGACPSYNLFFGADIQFTYGKNNDELVLPIFGDSVQNYKFNLLTKPQVVQLSHTLYKYSKYIDGL